MWYIFEIKDSHERMYPNLYDSLSPIVLVQLAHLAKYPLT